MTETTVLDIEINLDKAKRDTDKLHRSLGKLDTSGTKTQKTMKKTGEVAKSSADGFNFLKAAVVGVFSTAAVAGFIKVISTLEKLEFSLGVVFEGVERGKQVFKDIQILALATPFSIEQLTESVIKLRASGIEPTIAQLSLFADVASVSADSVGTLQAITDLFARTTSGGLGLEDLNRLMDRGIPVFSIFEEKLGLARLEISELGKSAEGAKMLLEALTEGLEERFGGAAKDAATLLANEISNLGVAWDLFLKSIGDTGVLTFMTEAIAGLSGVVNFLTENLDLVVIGMMGLATLAIPAVITAVKALTLAMAANPIGLIVIAVTGAVAALWYFRGVIFDTIIKIFKVTVPNAIDNMRISFLKAQKGISEMLNFVLGKIEKFGNELLTKTPDFLKDMFGISGTPFSLKIDIGKISSQIDDIEKIITDRILNFKPPPRPSWLFLGDDEDVEGDVEGLKTGGSLTGELAKPREEGGVSKKEFAAQESRLEIVRAFLRTETQALEVALLQRQDIITESFEKGVIDLDQKNLFMQELDKRHQDALTIITEKGWTERQKFAAMTTKEQTKQVIGELVNMTAGVAQYSKMMFNINKLAAVGNAIMRAHGAYNLAIETYPPPWGNIMGGIALAAGLAQVQAIRSTSFSGGGGGTTPSAAGSVPTINNTPIETSQSQKVGRQITIIIEGNVYANDDFREAIVEAIETAEDNDEIRFVNAN